MIGISRVGFAATLIGTSCYLMPALADVFVSPQYTITNDNEAKIVIARSVAADHREADIPVSHLFSIQAEQFDGIHISRAFAVDHDEGFGIPVSRQQSLQSEEASLNLVSRALAVESEASDILVSHALAELNGRSLQTISSNDSARALAVAGTLSQQLTALNAGPPSYNPETWSDVFRRNDNGADPFRCDQVGNPLDQGYVDPYFYLASADEVTLNNCGSAFYRFTFAIPTYATGPFFISGSANADDQGVVFLNGNRISGQMTVPGCNPVGPADPCYGQQDSGKDLADSQGRRVLTGPTLDPFESDQAAYFLLGLNELVFAVCGDAAYYEPTGIEFAAIVGYQLRGDLDCRDGMVDVDDIPAFTLAVIDANGFTLQFPGCDRLVADVNSDGFIDARDISAFVDLLLSETF